MGNYSISKKSVKTPWRHYDIMDLMKRDRAKIRVYFAAPSIELVDRRELVRRVRAILLGLGCELTYDWIEDLDNADSKSVYAKTVAGIKEADVVVAELTFSSTGVGEQIGLALSRKIPIVGVYLDSADRSFSSFFTEGMSQEQIQLVRYQPDNLRDLLARALDKIKKERFVKFNFISTPAINSFLEKEAKKNQETKSQYLRSLIREVMANKN